VESPLILPLGIAEWPCYHTFVANMVQEEENFRQPDLARRIGAALQRFPVAHSAASLAVRGISRPRRNTQIRRYLADNDVRKLRIGAGPHTDPGWLCCDLLPLSTDVVFMDATKPMPLPNGSFDVVMSEHMIEHLDLPGGRSMLAECRRILRPGGRIRIATPDLEKVTRCVFMSDTDSDSREYVALMNQVNPAIPDSDRDNPAYMINRVLRDWGHRFLYDEPTLVRLLLEEGFCDVVRCSVGCSTHSELIGVERHHEEIGVRHNLLETMVLEASVPTDT
jgi:predicted SAM-dependent methyltransferase